MLLICLTTWTIPVKVASAKTNEEQAIFINYGKFHKPILRSNEQPEPVESKASQSNSVNKPRPNQPSSSSQANSGRNLETASVYTGKSYSKEEVQQLIKDYSAKYGISPDLPLRVARCESGYNQFTKNRSSSASGVAQYIASTWRNTEAGKQGISVFDADANVHMMIKSIASGGIGNWNASKSCWSK